MFAYVNNTALVASLALAVLPIVLFVQAAL
ncbi:hypothetical protein [Caulobacter sp. NIBR2454]